MGIFVNLCTLISIIKYPPILQKYRKFSPKFPKIGPKFLIFWRKWTYQRKLGIKFNLVLISAFYTYLHQIVSKDCFHPPPFSPFYWATSFYYGFGHFLIFRPRPGFIISLSEGKEITIPEIHLRLTVILPTQLHCMFQERNNYYIRRALPLLRTLFSVGWRFLCRGLIITLGE